jgi:hypothetical protein
LVAATLYATYASWRARREFAFSLAPAGRAVALALLFVPLAFLHRSLPVEAALLVAGTVAYGALLLRFRVITFAEIVELRSHLRGAPAADLAAD